MWIIDDFTNLEMSGEDGGWTTVMFQFCRAVNERQVAIGGTPSTFLTGSGSAVSFPTMEQLKGLKLTGVNSPYARNIAGIVTSIRQLLYGIPSGSDPRGWPGYYTPEMNSVDQWTIADFNDAVGFKLLSEGWPDLTDRFERQTQTEYFTAIKNALDLLIWFKRGHGHVPRVIMPEEIYSPKGYVRYQNHVRSGQPGATPPKLNPPHYHSMGDGWDNREYLVDHYPEEPGDDQISAWGFTLWWMIIMEIGEHMILGSPVRDYWTDIVKGGEDIIADLRYMDTGAECTGSFQTMILQNQSSTDLDFSYAGVSGTIPANTDTATQVFLEDAAPSLELLNYGTLSLEIPEDSPFEDEIGRYVVLAEVRAIQVCFDATPVLTDKT